MRKALPLMSCLMRSKKKKATVKPVGNGPVYSGHPVYYDY